MFVSLVGILAGAVFVFFGSDAIIEFIASPLREVVGEIYFFAPQEAFIIKVKVALFGGILVAFPLVASQFWLFLSPGLHGHEKKVIIPVVVILSALFFAGVAFAFFLVMPTALAFLIGAATPSLRPMISMNEYVSFLSSMALAFGLAFNLPVFLMGAVSVGALTAQKLGYFRRHAIVCIFIAAAILTPGPDVASQLFLAVPLWALFEISVLGAWIMERFKK